MIVIIASQASRLWTACSFRYWRIAHLFLSANRGLLNASCCQFINRGNGSSFQSIVTCLAWLMLAFCIYANSVRWIFASR